MNMYFGEQGTILSFESETDTIQLKYVAFVPEVTDQLIGYSFLARGEETSTTLYLDVFCDTRDTNKRWTVVIKKKDSICLQVYNGSYRHIHDPEGKVYPVFDWSGEPIDSMLALKDFMEH